MGAHTTVLRVTVSTPPIDVPVVVAGGGPAGLAAAIELGRRGIEVLLLEPRATVSPDRPRAKTTSVRTMEHLRRWGIADRLRAMAPIPVAWSHDAVFVTSLLGREVTRFNQCFGLTAERCDLYAEAGQQVPQPLVETVLREAVACQRTVTLAIGSALAGLQEDESGVWVDVIDAEGTAHQLRTSYVLGCDGSTSPTRRSIGATYVGSTDGRSNFNIVFRAPGLGAHVPHGPAIHYWVLDPHVPGLVGRMDLHDTWWAMAMGVGAEEGAANPVRLVRALIGAADDGKAFEGQIEVVSTDPWTARMLNANIYGTRRVFLVGDAAHLNPPWGGHGYNTAVGDAVNIGWKLAAVLQGWAGAALLHSYEDERRPIAQQTIDLATRNMSQLSTNFNDARLDLEGEVGDATRKDVATQILLAKDPEFHSLGLELGYHYGTSPVVVTDATADLLSDTSTYLPSARPGCRLPHLWLADGRSLFDALGPDFTLLQLQAGELVELFATEAEALGIPMRFVDLVALGCDPCELRDLYGAELVLVRPDQHVAWRGAAGVVSAQLVRDILSRTSGTSATDSGKPVRSSDDDRSG